MDNQEGDTSDVSATNTGYTHDDPPSYDNSQSPEKTSPYPIQQVQHTGYPPPYGTQQYPDGASNTQTAQSTYPAVYQPQYQSQYPTQAYTMAPYGTQYAPQGATTVVTQPYAIRVVAPTPQPLSTSEPVCYLVWAIFSCLFCCWLLGIFGIVFAGLAVDGARRGKEESMQYNGKIAKWVNVAGTTIGVMMWVVVIIVISVN